MAEQVTHRTHDPGRSRLAGGIVGGVVGGIAIAAVMLLVALLQGADVWPGFKMAGYVFYGERVFEPGFEAGPVIVGVLSHFAVSIAWGLLFALLFYGFSKGATVAFGLLWGLVVWAAMIYIVLPIIGLGEMARTLPVGLSLVEHLVFGFFVALGFLPYQRQIPQQTYRRRVTV